MSFNVLYTDESIKEIDRVLNSKEFYIKTDGNLMYKAGNDIINLVMSHLTAEPSAPISKEEVLEQLRNFDIDKAVNS